MNDPDGVADLDGINYPVGVRPIRKAISMTPDPRCFIGLAISAFWPKLATAKASSILSRTGFGKFWKSFCAPLIQVISLIAMPL